MLGDLLKNLRHLNHLSQSDVARFLNISRSAYAMYETDRRQISYETLVRLADYYKVSIDYLMERTKDPDFPNHLSETERKLIQQFRQIDQKGREAVLAMLRYEYARIQIQEKTYPL